MENETKIFTKLSLYILLFPLFIFIFDYVLSTLGMEIGFWLAMSVYISTNLAVSLPLGYLTKLLMKRIKKLNFFFDIALFLITFNCKIWFAIWMFSIVGVDSSRDAVFFAFLATEALRLSLTTIVIPIIVLIKHLTNGFRSKGV